MRNLTVVCALVCLVAGAQPSVVTTNRKLDSAFLHYFKPEKRKTAQGFLIVTKLKGQMQFVFHLDGRQPKSVEISDALLKSKKSLNQRSISSRADLLSEWKVCEVYSSLEAQGTLNISIDPFRGKAPGRYLHFEVKPNGTVEWLPTE